jgi:hypothetical protein
VTKGRSSAFWIVGGGVLAAQTCAPTGEPAGGGVAKGQRAFWVVNAMLTGPNGLVPLDREFDRLEDERAGFGRSSAT